MGNWQIRCQNGDDFLMIYCFLLKFILKVGQVVMIWVLGVGVIYSFFIDLVWKVQNIWGCGSSFCIVFINFIGEEVVMCKLVCLLIMVEDNEDDDEDGEEFFYYYCVSGSCC